MLHGMAPERKARAIEDLTEYLVSSEAPADPPFDCRPASSRKGRSSITRLAASRAMLPRELPPRLAGRPAGARRVSNSSKLPGLRRSAADDLRAGTGGLPPRPGPVPSCGAHALDGAHGPRVHGHCRLPSRGPAASIRVHGSNRPRPQLRVFRAAFRPPPELRPPQACCRGNGRHVRPLASIGDDNIALRYRGFIQVPAAGDYRFYTVSDDGSKLLIDGTSVLTNDGIHPMTEKSGGITLPAGRHAITVLYFNATGDFGLEVSWEGPGFKAANPRLRALASRLPHDAPRGAAFGLGPGSRRAGARTLRSTELRRVPSDEHGRHGRVTSDATRGPRAFRVRRLPGPRPAPGLPRYALAPEDRDAIRKMLADKPGLAQPLDPRASTRRTMSLLNCYACHERDQQGGPEGLRRDYFSSLPPELDLGDEGRLPPRLTGVGAKLKNMDGPGALAGRLGPPYMATRMPQFGRENVGFLPAHSLPRTVWGQ